MVLVLDAVLQKSLSGSVMEGNDGLPCPRGFLKGLQGGRTDSGPKSAVMVGKPLPLTFTAESRGFLASSTMGLRLAGFGKCPGCLGVFQSFQACCFPRRRCLPPPDLHGLNPNSQNQSSDRETELTPSISMSC